jgi:hypothetical protein
MLRFLSRRQGRNKESTARTTLSPLDIPEILELIFSYLDNRNIRRSVVLVSRQWHLLNQNWLVCEVTWNQDWWPLRKA